MQEIVSCPGCLFPERAVPLWSFNRELFCLRVSSPSFSLQRDVRDPFLSSYFFVCSFFFFSPAFLAARECTEWRERVRCQKRAKASSREPELRDP